MRERAVFFIALSVAASIGFTRTGYAQALTPGETEGTQRAEARRKFADHRSRLLAEGFPIDPNELLEAGWPAKHATVLKAFLKTKGRFSEKTGWIAGVYVGDIVFLNPDTTANGDVTIVANTLAFKGESAVIRAPGKNVRIFVTDHVAHLRRTKTTGVRRLSLILDGARGMDGQVLASQSRIASDSRFLYGFRTLPGYRALLAQSSGGSGSNGGNGGNGTDGMPGRNGSNGPNGSCGGNRNGGSGQFASSGGDAGNGSAGTNATSGGNAGSATVSVPGDGSPFYFSAVGGDGGAGGAGGTGGNGGSGGNAGSGGSGSSCNDCSPGNGGDGGIGGSAGRGGDGGSGGDGGFGGNGGNITINLTCGDNFTWIETHTDGGGGGAAGPGGFGGFGGASGAGGSAGAGGSSACGGGGTWGQNGSPGTGGSSGNSGSNGNAGSAGLSGSRIENPTGTVCSGGGGGGGESCDGWEEDECLADEGTWWDEITCRCYWES